MSDKKKKFTRRAVLIGAATGATGAATALQDGNKGNLTGGTMALSEPFNVSGKLWIGPDSAKSQVEAKSGRVYMASDTDVDYYADSGSWELRSVGSDQVSVPSINTGQISIRNLSSEGVEYLDGRDPKTAIENADPNTTLKADPNIQHSVSAPIDVTADGLTIDGFNLKLADNTDDMMLFIHDCSNVAVENCYLDLNKSNNVQTGDYNNDGISITNASNVTVENTTVTQCATRGIMATGFKQLTGLDQGPVENIEIKNCTVTECDGGGIILAGGGGNDCKYGIVENCTIINPGNEGIQQIDGFQYGRFKNNYVESPNSHPIAIESHANRNGRPVRDALFDSCTLISSNDGGAIFSHTEYPYYDIRFENCRFEFGNSHGIEMTESGLDIRRLSVSNCTFIGPGPQSGSSGVQLSPPGGDGAKASEVNITGCYFEDVDTAVFKSQGGLYPWRVTNNTFEGVDVGITLQDSPGANISNNEIKNNATLGIVIKSDQFDAGSPVTINGVKIEGNLIESSNSGVGGIRTTVDNGGLDNYIIKNNRISVTATAIDDSASGANAIVADNLNY